MIHYEHCVQRGEQEEAKRQRLWRDVTRVGRSWQVISFGTLKQKPHTPVFPSHMVVIVYMERDGV
jgi:hypothetical protein